MAEDCAFGAMAACDDLWSQVPSGSSLQAVAATCGGMDPAGGHQGTCAEDFPFSTSGAPD